MECHKGFVALAQLVSPELVFFWGGGGVGMVTAGKMKNFTVLALAICLFLSQEPPHTTCRSYCIKPPQISAFCLDATFRSRQPPWFEYSTGTPLKFIKHDQNKWKKMSTWQVLKLPLWDGDPRDLQPMGDEGDGDSGSINHLAWKNLLKHGSGMFGSGPIWELHFTNPAQCVYSLSANRGTETDVFLGHGTWPNPNVRSLVLMDYSRLPSGGKVKVVEEDPHFQIGNASLFRVHFPLLAIRLRGCFFVWHVLVITNVVHYESLTMSVWLAEGRPRTWIQWLLQLMVSRLLFP